MVKMPAAPNWYAERHKVPMFSSLRGWEMPISK
jgi:hypothetical protein